MISLVNQDLERPTEQDHPRRFAIDRIPAFESDEAVPGHDQPQERAFDSMNAPQSRVASAKPSWVLEFNLAWITLREKRPQCFVFAKPALLAEVDGVEDRSLPRLLVLFFDRPDELLHPEPLNGKALRDEREGDDFLHPEQSVNRRKVGCMVFPAREESELSRRRQESQVVDREGVRIPNQSGLIRRQFGEDCQFDHLLETPSESMLVGRGETFSQLIAEISDVPRFGDDLDARACVGDE